MTVADMTYRFVKDLEVIDKTLAGIIDTETIVVYLNKGYDRFIHERYLSGGSMKNNVVLIQKNSDDLIKLIRRVGYSNPSSVSSDDPYYNYVKYVTIASEASDYLHYIRSDTRLTRTDVVEIASQRWIPNRLIGYDEIEKHLNTPYNNVIITNPLVFFEGEDRFYVLYDSMTAIEVSSEKVINMTYLKKPSKLVLEYTRTECYTSPNTFTIGDKVIVTGGTITYPVGGTVYSEGDIFTIIAGNLMVTFTAVNTGCLLGYYDIETQQCELAEYLHESIVKLATSIYLDENKFKLIKKT